MHSCTMTQSLIQSLESVPRRDLILFEGARISSKRLLADIGKTASFLKKVDARVVTINLPNIPNAVTAFYAANAAGAVCNMLHPLLPVKSLIAAMEKAESNLLFTFYDYYAANRQEFEARPEITVVLCCVSDYLPAAKKQVYRRFREKKLQHLLYHRDILKREDAAPLCPQETDAQNTPAVYLHSGGTTGTPKTIMLSNHAFNVLSDSLEHVIDNLDPAHHTCLSVLPLFHGFGLGVSMHTMLLHGFRIILMPKFDAKAALSQIHRYQVTLTAGIPKMYEKLLSVCPQKEGYLKTFEYCFSGGDKLPDKVKKAFDAALKKGGSVAELSEGYGLTECVTVCCVSERGDYRPDSMGKSLFGMQMKIISEDGQFLPPLEKGEIVVCSETKMLGYKDSDEYPFFKDAEGRTWLKTGDFGWADAEGRIYFQGRKKRVFKISGFSVFPYEIESVVARLDFVETCVAVESKQKPAAVKLFVKLCTQETAQEEAQERILQACRENLIGYSVPRSIRFVEEFPRTPVGKIDEPALREME